MKHSSTVRCENRCYNLASSEMELLSLLPAGTPLSALFTQTVARLVLAAVLGGIIGLEREFSRKPAGLRTNMFICIGSAMFTILSIEIAISHANSDATRIAAQIIPGIGFIGAGSILHARGGVTGLTTAATLFVVASVGMACGGGYYVSAVFATGLILVCLLLLGWMERQLNLKPILVNYTLATDHSMDEVMEELGAALEENDKEMRRTRVTKLNGRKRITFSVDATRGEHKQLLQRFRGSEPLRTIEASAERDAE